MEIKRIKTLEDFEKYIPDIEKLWESTREKIVFLSPIFLREYVKANEGENLLYLLMYENNNPVLLAPFEIRKRKVALSKWTELQFGLEGDFKNILLGDCVVNYDTSIKNLFKYIEKLSVDRVVLDNILPQTNLSKYILKNQKLNGHFSQQNMVPTLKFDEYENFDEYNKTFPSNTRKYKNKILRERNIEFEVVDNMNEELYNEIKNIHIEEKKFLKSLGRSERYSLYEDEKREEFIKNVQIGSNLVKNFIIRDIDKNKVIAYRNCYVNGDELVSWNTGYDPDYREYRLNNALFYFIFEDLFKGNEFKKFNFGVGGYPWKFGYANSFTNIYILDLFLSDKGKKIKKMIGFKKALEELK